MTPVWFLQLCYGRTRVTYRGGSYHVEFQYRRVYPVLRVCAWATWATADTMEEARRLCREHEALVAGVESRVSPDACKPDYVK